MKVASLVTSEPKRDHERPVDGVGPGRYARGLRGGTSGMRRLSLVLVLSIAPIGCAATTADRSASRDPETVRAVAEALLEEGDRLVVEARPGDSLNRAIRAYQAAIDADPLLFHGHLKLAYCYYLTHQPELEQAEYRKALAVNPRSVDAWERLGHARLSQDDLDGARSAYEEALELDPTHGVVLYNLGLVEGDLGHVDRARELFERARRAASRRPPR
jgi:tetratricopeptide (TPR) repeat protein